MLIRRTVGSVDRLMAFAALVCAGCGQPARPTAPQPGKGLIWLFPGVEGGAWSLKGPCRAFRDEGVKAAIRIHDWWKPFGALTNLTSYEQNRADAGRVADEITACQREHPGWPVDLVGYSAGGGMAIMVAEALPEEIRLRNVVLAHPALSPDYDLSKALRRIDGKLVSFYSPYDWWTLGAGTSLFGTMDRTFTASAGKDGFRVSRAIREEALRARFEQRAWSSEALSAGHLGMHLGILGYEWNRRFVAPYLRPDRQRTTPARSGDCSASGERGAVRR